MRAGRQRRPPALALLAGRITVSGSAVLGRVPSDGLVAEFREVIVNLRPRADAELIERACDVAARCHQGQLRYSGDPYITHPVAVATILAGLEEAGEVDDQMLCAAILHETVEDTPYTLAALKRDFGAAIAAMVAEHMVLPARLRRRPGHKAAQEAREAARLAGKTPILLKEVLAARETVASFGEAIAALNLLFGDVPQHP